VVLGSSEWGIKEKRLKHSDSPPMVSRRDLLGAAGMLGVALAMPVRAKALAPALLTDADAALLGEIADIIIPATDTGGAKAAGTAEFARMMVSDWFVEEEQQRFLAGLREFEKESRRVHGGEFLKLSGEQREAMVGSVLATAEARTAGPNGRPPFIIVMKRLTVLGYYTSEIGASEELELNLAPGRYEPCAPAGPLVRAGSTGFSNPDFSAS
jgi:hypothetical protein